MSNAVSKTVDTAIRSLRFREYDWDGAGGLPMRDDVADTAIDLFANWLLVADHASIPIPEISLSANGTVEVAFSTDEGRQLLLTFECAGVVTYIKAYEDAQTTVEGVVRMSTNFLEPDDFSELTELFDWLISE